MGVRYPIVFSTTLVGVFSGFPAEPVAVTTPPLALPLDGAAVYLQWYVKYTAGATGPAVSYNIRRGTTAAAALVNPSNVVVTELGGVNIARGGCMVDNAAGISMPQYSLTLNVTNAASNGAFIEACLIAFAL